MNKVKFVIFTLTFCELLADLDARTCGKGHFLTLRRQCEICPEGQYQPKENSFTCIACTTCETDRGSDTDTSCTKETDTKCKCREGFVPWGDDTSTCKCEPGFGLTDGKCSKCENGYFNKIRNSACRKWTECEYGVKINGTTTSDVVCNQLNINRDITIPNTACSTKLQTQNRDTTTITTTSSSSSTTTTAAPPGHTLTTNRKLQPPTPLNTGNYTGLVLLLFGIGALIILTAVTCKLHIAPCVRNPSKRSKDSMCRRPVEEIGDGSLSSLKLNPEP